MVYSLNFFSNLDEYLPSETSSDDLSEYKIKRKNKFKRIKSGMFIFFIYFT